MPPDTYAKAHRARRKTQPAAAPLETDTEAGGGHGQPIAEGEPADTYMVDTKGTVRAGAANLDPAPDWSRDKAPRVNRAIILGVCAVLIAVMAAVLLLR